MGMVPLVIWASLDKYMNKTFKPGPITGAYYSPGAYAIDTGIGQLEVVGIQCESDYEYYERTYSGTPHSYRKL